STCVRSWPRCVHRESPAGWSSLVRGAAPRAVSKFLRRSRSRDCRWVRLQAATADRRSTPGRSPRAGIRPPTSDRGDGLLAGAGPHVRAARAPVVLLRVVNDLADAEAAKHFQQPKGWAAG